jgi:predicted ABC-type exoprotein transport system permease subunit
MRTRCLVFGPKKEEVAEIWRIVRNKEVHILYASSNIVRVIKSRRMRWEGHVAEMRNIYKFWKENLKG